ncbi:MAG: hypothetical protein MMC33_001279 [Icmadophila ericetorum]|nr:hypothetical protein [Icmadophila ericetorum]
MAERILMNEYKALSKEEWVKIEPSEANILEWTVALIVTNEDSFYYGSYLKAKMTFPKNYPYSPPEFKFLRPLFHPNIYEDGRLCISILHAPGEDAMSGESAAERWTPAQRVESVLLSIISLLDDAECSSPANVDAGVLLRKDLEAYKKRVKQDVDQSKNDIPEGFVMPTMEHLNRRNLPEKADDPDFWMDSDEEHDFGGSDTDAEMTQESGGEEEDDGDKDEEEDEEDL